MSDADRNCLVGEYMAVGNQTDTEEMCLTDAAFEVLKPVLY